MTENIDVFYGGRYHEDWDEHYRLTVLYEDRSCLNMQFHDGRWIANGQFPNISGAEVYFSQAASAAVAARRFIASGLSAQDISALSPDLASGAVFAAEVMRILMDDYGLHMELVYPYVADLCPAKTIMPDMLHVLQPRTAHVLQLMLSLRESLPAVRHDARLEIYHSPYGALRAGDSLRLSMRCVFGSVEDAMLELFGDDLYEVFPMTEESGTFSVQLTTPDKAEVLWYRFRIHSGGRLLWLCPSSDGVHACLHEEPEDGFRLTVYDRTFDTPAWFQKAVMYQIFPDRFAFTDDGGAEKGIQYHRGMGQSPELHTSLSEEVRWRPREFETDYSPDDFYGGRLEGIRRELPYLQSLGITCIYLNPIVEARSNHRYDTSDYLRVDPILGSTEDFRVLCAEAQSFGIRILCDGVFSHTGADSIYFNRDGHYPEPGACQEETSPYDSWYDFKSFPDDYRSWWGFRDLPEVDEHDPGWQRFVITGKDSVVRYWLRQGASGWRLDVADELPDDVLQLIRVAAKEERKDAVILGEVWEDAVLKESYGSRRKYALGNALDSVMNYPFRNEVLDFLSERSNAFDLADFLTSQQMHYPYPLYVSLMNLLGSHDVARLRTVLSCGMQLKDFSREEQLVIEAEIGEADRERARRLSHLAFAIQFSIPGVPSIYYGDEQGMTGTNDPFNRRPFVKNRNDNEVQFLRYLSKWHIDSTDYKAFFLASDADVLLILRYCADDFMLTVVNRSEETRSFSFEYAGFSFSDEIQPQSAAFFQK